MRPSHRTGMIALTTLLAVAIGSPPAEAAPSSREPRAGLLPLQFEGDVKTAWRAKLQEDLERGLAQTGMAVVDPKAVIEASGGVGDCRNAKCFQFLSQSVQARFLVRTTITVEERNYEIALDIIDGRDGSLAASSKETCQLCGLAEVGELVAKQAVVLRQKVDMLALEPAVVAITSEPAGAIISIDGQRIGPAPLEHELSPGAHEAKAQKEGFIEQVRTIEAMQGVRERLTFELLPAPVTETEDEPARRDWMPPVGWSLLGVGVAGLASGVTFLAIDERPYRTRCSGPDIDPLGNCRQRYNTLTHGIVLSATGGALAITGAALLITARVKRGRRAKAMAQRLRVGPGTLGGRF